MRAETPRKVRRDQLPDALGRMRPGEKVTLVDEAGTPLATVVRPNTGAERPMSIEKWEAEWDVLAEKVSKAWKGDLNAIEAVAEQRR